MRFQLAQVRSPLLLYLVVVALFSGTHGPATSKFFLPATAATTAPRKIPVGLVLDLSIDSVVGRTSRTSIYMAVEDFYAGRGRDYSTRIDLRVRDYNGDVVNATADVVDLISNDGVVAVIGPQRPQELSFVVEIGTAARVPIFSFFATATSLSRKSTPYFIRAAHNDSAQAAAVASLAKAFGWRQLVPVYEDSDYGSGFVPLLVDALKEAADCRVPARAAIPPGASKDRIRSELLQLKTMQTRAFVVHARRGLAEKVFEVAGAVGMIEEGYAWIATESMMSLLGAVQPDLVLQDMQGVVGFRPYVPATEKRKVFLKRWKKQFIKENPHDEDAYDAELNAFGLWAYDTVFALAEAVESVYGNGGSGAAMPVPVDPRTAATNSNLSSLPLVPAGERLLNAILLTHIRDGMSGEFQLVDGELRPTAFEIVNVNGQTANVVGYWTESRGLSRKLDLSMAPENTTQRRAQTRNDLELIKWPGGTAATPKGWEENPMAGKRLRIFVPGPTEPGFSAFLQSNMDNTTNVTMDVTGYVVEVFQAAVKELPYAILWDYETERTKEGKSIGNYNQLVELVSNGTYDAIVGDVTITARRAELVDFTLPYTTSGVRMVVPNRDDSRTSLWIFLKPLTNSLWIVSGCFFVYTGFAVWVSERRVNEDFRQGSVRNQIGSVFYFSFSTLVFAHRHEVNSNASRVALVVWLFVVWILQSSYTASLTSMLTVNQVQPTVAEIKDLLSSGEYIGHLENSFVKKLLLDMGFPQKRLRHYKSPQQYADALELGSGNGGVGAVVDEIPYLKIFLKDHCSNYTITGQTIRTGGFGFVFPKGSPLTPDLSRAILNITEGDVMAEIERKWFGDDLACASDKSPISSNRLDVAMFGGLFIITSATTVAMLLFFLFRFVYRHRKIVIEKESGGSMIQRVGTLVREFDKKKEDAIEGSQRSARRRRQSSHTHVCDRCGCNGMLPGVVGGDGREVGSESAIGIVVDLAVPSPHGGETTSYHRPTSPPSSIDLSTPSRTSTDCPATAAASARPSVSATPSTEMSPVRSIASTEPSGDVSQGMPT